VNLEDETSELVKSTQEMNNDSLSKMGFTKINGKWVSKDGDHGASSSVAVADFDEEDQAADMDFHHEEQPETNLGVGTSVGNQGDERPSMSSFERYLYISSVPSRIRALTKSRSKSTTEESKSTQGVA